MNGASGASSQAKPRLPRMVWMLGFVSLLMDISSELIHALLPIFLVTTLGASTFTVGIIEGVAEAATAMTKVFSGVISDWISKRKPLVVLGYGLAALTKPLFPLASTVELLVAARVPGAATTSKLKLGRRRRNLASTRRNVRPRGNDAPASELVANAGREP